MAGYLRAIDLPGLHLDGNLFLAPLAGYSDAAFRELCIRFGADLCYTEMVSAEALARGSRKTLQLARRGDNEANLAIQLFGRDPSSFARAVRLLEPLQPALYDLNCGCAVSKVLRSGAGAALLREPDRIAEILRAMRGETRAPVSVKLRSGWDLQNLNYLQTGLAAVEAGAALLALHPRTRSQGFTGRSDWSHIRRLKELSPVPVFGSGDLLLPSDALAMFRDTGCDGLMFARGALGNPFVFAQTRRLLQSPASADNLCQPSPVDRLNTALEHLERAAALKGEPIACREMRKHLCHYAKGLPGSAQLRQGAVRAGTVREYRELIHRYLAGR